MKQNTNDMNTSVSYMSYHTYRLLYYCTTLVLVPSSPYKGHHSYETPCLVLQRGKMYNTGIYTYAIRKYFGTRNNLIASSLA